MESHQINIRCCRKCQKTRKPKNITFSQIVRPRGLCNVNEGGGIQEFGYTNLQYSIKKEANVELIIIPG